MTASLVQLIVPDHLRGRVVSIYMVAFRGGMPLGKPRGAPPHVAASARYARRGGGVALTGPLAAWISKLIDLGHC